MYALWRHEKLAMTVDKPTPKKVDYYSIHCQFLVHNNNYYICLTAFSYTTGMKIYQRLVVILYEELVAYCFGPIANLKGPYSEPSLSVCLSVCL